MQWFSDAVLGFLEQVGDVLVWLDEFIFGVSDES